MQTVSRSSSCRSLTCAPTQLLGLLILCCKSRARLLCTLLFFLHVQSIHADAVQPLTEPLDRIRLSNQKLMLELTPNLGGRGLHFALHGYDNVLKVGAVVNDIPQPEVSAFADNIPYLGHIVWLGPQSDWWLRQSANQQRLKAKANWPPDPYLILGRNTVLEKSQSIVKLKGLESDVSGMRVDKVFELEIGQPHGAIMQASATNIQAKGSLPWDLWFNTRIAGDAQVYVPVTDTDDIRVEYFSKLGKGRLGHEIESGIMALSWRPLLDDESMRRSKLFIQPSAGWMAAFTEKQCFIVQFALEDASQIHPNQAQVELYLDVRPNQHRDGLIELEVHAPYKTLAPGETMRAQERWILFPYPGSNDVSEQRQFLQQHIVEWLAPRV